MAGLLGFSSSGAVKEFLLAKGYEPARFSSDGQSVSLRKAGSHTSKSDVPTQRLQLSEKTLLVPDLRRKLLLTGDPSGVVPVALKSNTSDFNLTAQTPQSTFSIATPRVVSVAGSDNLASSGSKAMGTKLSATGSVSTTSDKKKTKLPDSSQLDSSDGKHTVGGAMFDGAKDDTFNTSGRTDPQTTSTPSVPSVFGRVNSDPAKPSKAQDDQKIVVDPASLFGPLSDNTASKQSMQRNQTRAGTVASASPTGVTRADTASGDDTDVEETDHDPARSKGSVKFSQVNTLRPLPAVPARTEPAPSAKNKRSAQMQMSDNSVSQVVSGTAEKQAPTPQRLSKAPTFTSAFSLKQVPLSPKDTASGDKGSALDELEAAVLASAPTSLEPDGVESDAYVPSLARSESSLSPHLQRRLAKLRGPARLQILGRFVQDMHRALEAAADRINDRRLRKSATHHVYATLRDVQSQKLQLIHRDVTRLHRVGFYLKSKIDKLQQPRHAAISTRLAASEMVGIAEKLSLGEKTMVQLKTALADLNRKLLGGLLLAGAHKRKRARAFMIWKTALQELHSHVEHRRKAAQDAVVSAYSREAERLFGRNRSTRDHVQSDTDDGSDDDRDTFRIEERPHLHGSSDTAVWQDAAQAACWQPIGRALVPELLKAVAHARTKKGSSQAVWKMVFLATHPSDVRQSTNLRWVQAVLREQREAPTSGDGFGVIQPFVLENSTGCLAYRLAQSTAAGRTCNVPHEQGTMAPAILRGEDVCLDFVLLRGPGPPKWQNWLRQRAQQRPVGNQHELAAKASDGTFPLVGAHAISVLLEPSATAMTIREGDTLRFPVEAWVEACSELCVRIGSALDALWEYTASLHGLERLGGRDLLEAVRHRCSIVVDVIVDCQQLEIPSQQQEQVSFANYAMMFNIATCR